MNAPVVTIVDVAARLAAVEQVLGSMGEIAVAVSGGVDSMTLATLAHRLRGDAVCMFHATSPAVPSEATQRTQQLAQREGWNLCVIDAGEFHSSDYMANPINRCFYCKTSLYGAIRPHTAAQMVSGANLDDLGEYRPGLIAAKEHGVRHPWVEAQISKQTVRAIARHLDLQDLAELPASPCLSSRIETGIGIDAAMLACVHQTERLISRKLDPKTVRCRVRAQGVVVELDQACLAGLSEEQHDVLAAEVRQLFEESGFTYVVSFAVYRVGSAFLHSIKLIRPQPSHEPSRDAP